MKRLWLKGFLNSKSPHGKSQSGIIIKLHILNGSTCGVNFKVFLDFFFIISLETWIISTENTAFLMNHFRLILLVLVIEKVSRAQLLSSECPVDPATAGCAELSSGTWRCC